MVANESVIMVSIFVSAFLSILSIAYAFLSQTLGRKKKLSPGEKILKSISDLKHASQNADDIILDLIQELQDYQSMLEVLKARSEAFQKEETELKKRIEVLKDTPPEVMKYFEQSLQQMEKKRTRRDILFFILGIGSTTLITVIVTMFL